MAWVRNSIYQFVMVLMEYVKIYLTNYKYIPYASYTSLY